ncbi:hypothetical protein BVRB_2g041730 [Beta vulgaris subsp. vulgaris]|nr:hypothetical protein BVRB_2g041730 [Beta vulgaris subsp. vulgaris]
MRLVKGGIQQKTIKQWEKQLRIIEAVLSDAEQKQVQSNAVKSWMQDLQDLAYDLEDVLDAFATQAQIYELSIMNDSHSSELKDNDTKFMAESIIVGGSKAIEHLSFMFNSGQDFSGRIEEISQQLEEILSQTEGLGLSVHVMHQQVVPTTTAQRWQSWRESTSLLCEPFVYGREGDKKEIMHRLLHDKNSSSGNYIVIPIVGKGGIGKTTLAQLIYNDEEVDVFSLKAWVYVSQVFDAKRVTTSILNSITGEANSFCDLNQAQVRLQQVLRNKRFLIILDDMWSVMYSDWDDLRTPLRAGAKGSRVIVTTRIQKVARIMNPQMNNMILLECLADDDCWHLILQHAFDDANIAISPNISLMRAEMECSVRKDYRARHLSFSKLDECEDLFHLKNISHFRTFAQFDKHPSSSSRVLELIGYFQYLRVLLLPSLGITNFPESIGDLKLLRYLNLSYNDFEELPNSVSNLVNLQTLLLKGCVKLQKLSTNMRCLINLRHLDIDGTSLNEMPLGLGNLTNLQTLHRFVLGANAPIIKELKNLKQLRGKLTIAGLENLVSSNDAGEARLNEKSCLHELEMVWEWGTFTNGIDDNTKIDVLDQLHPHRSTKVLTLRNYKGLTFPSWLSDPSFTKMVVIRLIGCERCESLPSLGKLPSLKELVVQEMRGLKSVDDDFYGVGCSNPFPALITLKFKSMFSWESWLISSADTKVFSNLQELSIKDSPLLQHLSLPSCLPLLETLEIQHCKKLDASLPTLPHLQKLVLEDCSSLFMVDQLSTTLRQLAISNCRKLQLVEFRRPCFSLDENISLEVVEVVNCQSLLNFFSRDGIEVLHHVPGHLSGLHTPGGLGGRILKCRVSWQE